MADKILKEALDKLTAIEEADWGDEPYQNYKPEEANDQYDKKTGKWSRSGQYDEPAEDRSQMHVNQIKDMLDDARDELFDSPVREDYGNGVNDMYDYLARRLGL